MFEDYVETHENASKALNIPNYGTYRVSITHCSDIMFVIQ